MDFKVDGVRPFSFKLPTSESSATNPLSHLTSKQKEDLIGLLMKIFEALAKAIEKANGDDEEPDEDDPADEPPPHHGKHNTPAETHSPKAGNLTNSPFNAGPNPEIAKWSKQIGTAASVSGLDPNLIAAQTWAESRGNPNDPSRNADGTTDKGLIQIGQERWERDIVPTLSKEDRARIKQATGKEPEDLDMDNPQENLIGGAFEMKKDLKETHGDLSKALKMYVGHDGDSNDIYAKNVLQYMDELRKGRRLSEDPFGSP